MSQVSNQSINSERAVFNPVASADVAGGERSSARRAAAHLVTAEEAASGAYVIDDVVLPLPGGQIQYPAYKDGSGTSQQVCFCKAVHQSCRSPHCRHTRAVCGAISTAALAYMVRGGSKQGQMVQFGLVQKPGAYKKICTSKCTSSVFLTRISKSVHTGECGKQNLKASRHVHQVIAIVIVPSCTVRQCKALTKRLLRLPG